MNTVQGFGTVIIVICIRIINKTIKDYGNDVITEIEKCARRWRD